MKNIILFCVFALCSHAAFSQELQFEAGYTRVSADDGGASIDLGALYGSVSYAFNTLGRYTNEFEGSVWFGVADDSFGGADISLERSFEAGYRGRFSSATSDQSFFWRAVYTQITFEAESVNGSNSFIEAESGFGLGFGAQYRRITVGYTKYLGDLDDFSRINIGYRF